MLGIIKRNFIYLSEEAFVSLYKTLVRSHLEYANSVWNPYRMGLIKDLERWFVDTANWFSVSDIDVIIDCLCCD